MRKKMNKGREHSARDEGNDLAMAAAALFPIAHLAHEYEQFGRAIEREERADMLRT
jgi:hypothetical protein